MERLVSVIIPMYNASRFISDTLQSVIGQTYQNLQILVVDDGSVDAGPEIIQAFQKSDGRIRLIRQENKGCSFAKNTGLLHATGDYIQYLDADDILSSDKIKEQVDALQNDPFLVAVCRTKLFQDKIMDASKEIDSEYLFSTDDPLHFLLNLYGLHGEAGMIQPNAFLISRQLSDKISNWDTSLSPSTDEDGEYFCRVILSSTGIVFTPRSLNFYRRQNQKKVSLSNAQSALHVKGALRSLELKARHLMDREDSPRVRKVIAKNYAHYIYQYFGKYPEQMAEAFRLLYNTAGCAIPAVGSSRFKWLSRFLGFERSLKFRQFID